MRFLPLALAALLLPLPTSAATQTVKGIKWTYYIYRGEAEIGDDLLAAIPTSTSGAITIPTTLGGCPVTRIASCAFRYCYDLTSVKIPDSVMSIGGWAFANCGALTSVKIPDSVTYVGKAAFSGSSSLTSVTIGNGVTRIGNEAFNSCYSLTSVKIPDSVTTIGEGAFAYCSGLRSVTIGNGVKSIGENAFQCCRGLTSVAIPDSVTSIGDWAFAYCKSLTSLTIPDSVTSIGDWAFGDCLSLEKLYLPSRFKGQTSNMGIPSGCSVVFHASNVPAYSVAFNANGGTGAMAAQTLTYGKATALTKNAFKRKDYVFLGWAKSKDGAVAYQNAQSVKNLAAAGKSVTLYAQWAKISYKVQFCHTYKDETGKMATESMTYGKAKKLSANKFKRTGFVFQGWAKSKADAKAGKVAYANKKSVKNLVTNGKTVKLYAVWKKK